MTTTQMQGCAAPRGAWCTGVVREVRHPVPEAVLLRLEVQGRTDHLPGQHYVFRLTAEDGYTASRSYSVASAPGDPLLEFYVERLDDGEVSTYLADVVQPGDELELRGPIGGWFVWEGDGPALLVGGGSGVVPLMAMLRYARLTGKADLLRLVVSVRTPDDLYYSDEIFGPQTTVIYTRATPAGFARAPARLAPADIPQPIASGIRGYVCGSSGFADAASHLLDDLGVPTAQVRVERFGPSG
jgi:ferredoxin-NADP reductase